jgi:hypothetical protein
MEDVTRMSGLPVVCSILSGSRLNLASFMTLPIEALAACVLPALFLKLHFKCMADKARPDGKPYGRPEEDVQSDGKFSMACPACPATHLSTAANCWKSSYHLALL